MTEDDLLVPENTYLTSGTHIGTQQKSRDMMPFIFKVRDDGLYVLDIKETDRRIRLAADFIKQFEPNSVLVVSARQYGQRPVKRFGEVTGTNVIAGRFIPGTMTNPAIKTFQEPKLILVTDPATDSQPLAEAISIGIPVIGLCDANNETKHVDLVVPTNNKGRKALALVYYLLAREVLLRRGAIESPDKFTLTPDDFESQL
ncbi:MAG: 30S ribosomal protein S2 [Thermoplasmata archaeon]|nr:30S ribosomal protein S2 [Thermoplasmata archaeon]